MYKLIEVVPVNSYKLFLKYSNGITGEYDLSNLIYNDEYKTLRNEKSFRQVYIDEKTNDLVWPCGITLCKNAIYRQLELRSLMKNLNIDLDKI